MRALLASVVLACLSAGPAWAQVDPCLQHPVSCVEDTVTDVTDTTDETVEDVGAAADDTVDEITGSGGDAIDDVRGGGGEPSGSDGSGGGGSAGGGGDASGERRSGGAGDGASIVPSAIAASTAAREQTTAAQSPALRRPSIVERVRRAFEESPGTFIFPLALVFLVGMFLAAQSRFDRSDPKLALAPIDAADDVLEFR